MMDNRKYSTLMDAAAAVPDPRKARGKRHPWAVIMAVIAAALVAGQRNGRAIGQWVGEHAADLRSQLGLVNRALPSPSTLRRALRSVDVAALEAHLTQFTQELPPPPGPSPAAAWQGQAVDGKAVRGAQAHGEKVHLVSLVQHQPALIHKQLRVATKSNEITAVPDLLRGCDLQGIVITLDAHLTQQAIAQQILDQHGHYLMVVKANQPSVYAAIELLFAPPWQPDPEDDYQRHTRLEKGHGRLETRTLERTSALNDYLDWPGVGQVLRRECERIILKTGQVSREVSYGITSLAVQEASAAQLEGLWRGHWTIENQVHYVRDVTLGEDAGQVWRGAAPQALAALRNGILSLLRWQGATNIADALRHYGASVQRIFALIGVPSGL
jgi:predicted transposase YbfD/YdcC